MSFQIQSHMNFVIFVCYVHSKMKEIAQMVVVLAVILVIQVDANSEGGYPSKHNCKILYIFTVC